MQAGEAKAPKLDLEIGSAIKNLVEKINSNKGVSNCYVLFLSDSPHSLATPLADLDFQGDTDHSVKRPAAKGLSGTASKRQRICRLSPRKELDTRDTMGRKSRGDSYNELNKLKNGNCNWDSYTVELLRTSPGLS